MANRAYKYRIYPTPEQTDLLTRTFGCCRKIWNLMLNDKIRSYEDTGTFGRLASAMYKEEYPFLREVDSLALANVQMHLQQAMKNCFVSRHCRFPKFKSAKHSRRSYTTNNQKNSIRLCGGGIRLPKIGIVKAKLHRLPGEDWAIKSATVSQDPDGCYYVSILFEYEASVPDRKPDQEKAIGLDYKSDGLYMDSMGHVAGSPKFYRKSQEKLAKAQRSFSRKQRGSKGYEKQRVKVASVHKHIANQRLDFLHKLSTEIANRYDVVCAEDLDMKAISNNGFGLGKATTDNGYGEFLRMLEYKLAERGKRLIRVSRWYPSSRTCSCCGRKMKLALSERAYRCVCGAVIDRDLNAAVNILREGLRLLQEEAA